MNFASRLLLKHRIRKLVRLHMKIDQAMMKRLWPSWKRKQWWSDFIKSPAARKEFCMGLLKDLTVLK
jgi:hypothetical protein